MQDKPGDIPDIALVEIRDLSREMESNKPKSKGYSEKLT